MSKPLTRHDFVIKDLVVSVGGVGRGSVWLPAEDGKLPTTPLSPVAAVFSKSHVFEAVRSAVLDAVKTHGLADIAKAFTAEGGNPIIRNAVQEIGLAVVGSAAFAALDRGTVGRPDPEKTLDTIPTPLTPTIDVGLRVHKVTDLPRLRHQLAEMIQHVERIAASYAPKGSDVDGVRVELEAALRNLPK